MKLLQNIRKWQSDDCRWVWIVPILGFINAIGIQWISRTGVPRTDDWTQCNSVLNALFSKSISWDYLWSQYGETRPILARFLILSEYYITGHICTMFSMIISELMAFGIIVIIVRHLNSLLGKQHKMLLFILTVLTSTMMETPINIDQIQWWDLFCYKGCVLGMLLTCITAANHDIYVTKFGFWLGILLALATHGYWILLLPLLILYSAYRWIVTTDHAHSTLLINLGIFIPVMAILGYLFFTVHYTTNTQAVWSSSQLMASPSRWIYLFFGTLANPFHFALSTPYVETQSLALGVMTIIGMIGALFCGFAVLQSLFRKQPHMENICVLFILSGFIFSGTLMLGRGQLIQGFYPIIVFHYVILFVPFWIAFFWIILYQLEQHRNCVGAYVVTLLSVFLLINAIYAGTKINRQMVRDIKREGVLLEIAMQYDEATALRLLKPSIIHPDPTLLLKTAKWMNEKRVLPTLVP